MPEGDTMWRTADRLRPAIDGRTVVSFEVERWAGPIPAEGWVVDGIEAKGKYLLIHFAGPGEDALTLETHMKMTGSWHLYRVGERWRRARSRARVVLEMDNGWSAICFDAPHVRVTPDSSGPSHLGPDLCAPDPDLDAAVVNFGVILPGSTPLGVALLDQRVCCGVGNVYKSEVLHACAISPLTPVADVTIDQRLDIVTTAHRMLRANLGPGRRVTVSIPGTGGVAVYGRGGEACPRCGRTIERIVQGEHVRSTYWCPGCQSGTDHQSPGVTIPDS